MDDLVRLAPLRVSPASTLSREIGISRIEKSLKITESFWNHLTAVRINRKAWFRHGNSTLASLQPSVPQVGR